MCGIAGLYLKSATLQTELGEHLGEMLEQLSFRGPDSAGVAFYRRAGAGRARSRYRCTRRTPSSTGTPLAAELAAEFGERQRPSVRATHAVFVDRRRRRRRPGVAGEHHPELRVMSAGRRSRSSRRPDRRRPSSSASRWREIAGTHALGHTRMATESRVTTAALAPVLDRASTCAWSTTARSRTTTGCAASCSGRDPVPDRQRLRGRRRLPDVAARRGPRSNRRSRAV